MNLVFPRLYAIIDPTLLTISELDLAETLAGSGVELIQYRNKTASSRQFFEISRQLSSALKRRGVRLIVNDRPDVALLAGAGGVHVGQDDLPVEDARVIFSGLDSEDRWVGVSTHTLEQLAAADRTSADYIALGPIFPTSTKKNPDPVVGTELLRRARQLTKKPLVAIGGITLERAAEVFLRRCRFGCRDSRSDHLRPELPALGRASTSDGCLRNASRRMREKRNRCQPGMPRSMWLRKNLCGSRLFLAKTIEVRNWHGFTGHGITRTVSFPRAGLARGICFFCVLLESRSLASLGMTARLPFPQPV